MVPLIDVLCFMLIFFFVFSTFKNAQTGVEVDLPKAVHLGQTEQNTVVISIDRNARVFFGEEPVSMDALKSRIAGELNRNRETRFIVKPDADVPYRAIIAVTDILAGYGVDKPLWGVDRQQMPHSAE